MAGRPRGPSSAICPDKGQQPSFPTWMRSIRAHINSVGGIQNLNTDLDKPRFQLVFYACCNEDLFCVALHQLFCIWDQSNHTQITKLPGLPDQSILLPAFTILGQLILGNQGPAPNHKLWFAQFPGPLEGLMRSSKHYQESIKEVGLFLGKLSTDWGSFSKKCTARRYAPRINEIEEQLELPSLLLQRVVFQAFCRKMKTNK
ncbi:hypothetical protein B0J14DRAFT_159419 [Halenospora varia]|nr:hypothetical protein B0J14DRAFT_159419 [Halenospora varia]